MMRMPTANTVKEVKDFCRLVSLRSSGNRSEAEI